MNWNKKVWKEIIEEDDIALDKAKTMKEASAISNKNSNEVKKSVGWIDEETTEWKHPHPKSTATYPVTEWGVILEDGGIYCTEDKEHAEVISYLTQLLALTMRMEKKIKKLEEKLTEKKKP